ncbi:MAG TPA: hypothetical protein VFJ93_13635 [Gaiellaceae bacterium]|nr:hypothetical protein [Gaiellaceae bacterium]
MAMLRVCGHPGCGTLTLGELCIEHEAPTEQDVSPAFRHRERVVPAVAAVSQSRGPSEADERRPAI